MRAHQFISEKAVSKKQQKFFGIARAMQKGDMPKSGAAGEVAKDMKKSDVKDFAKTKHKGLPEKKTSEEAAGVGIVTKQNATADVPVGGEYMNVKKLFPKKKKKKTYEDMFQGLNPKSEIYVDMDGVLADFFGEWKKLVGKDWRELGKDEIEPALKKIRDEDKFWLNIPLTANAKNLLGVIKQVKGDYKILSSPLANDPNSEPHKREWIEKNLDFFPPTEVIITKDKAKYATNPDGTPNILIDDYGVNIAAWESAGGIGFKHKDHKFERTAKKLKAEIEEDFQHLVREHIEENFANGSLTAQQMLDKLSKEMQGTHTGSSDPKSDWSKYVLSHEGFTLKDIQVDQIPTAVKSDGMSQANIEKYKKADTTKFPPVVIGNNGYLLDGNHRLQAYKAQGIKTIKAYIGENFADGKKKGKSRPGRVKKSGASCNGSVTDLRKRAKNSSGEKAKMYHWCANMKSGKKKK